MRAAVCALFTLTSLTSSLAQAASASAPGVIAQYPPPDTTVSPVLNIGSPFGGFDFQQDVLNEFATAFEIPPGQSWRITGLQIMDSLVCSTGGSYSMRLYTSAADARVPGNQVFAQQDSTCWDDLGTITIDSAQYRRIQINVCGASSEFVLDNPGPDPIRVWPSFWGLHCLTQATWGVCQPQVDVSTPAAYRCGVPDNCIAGQTVNVWTDYASLGQSLPNCVPYTTLLGTTVPIDEIFADGFELIAPSQL